MEISLKTLNEFVGVGVKWQGTFEEAENGDIREVFAQFKEDVHSIPNRVEPQVIYGLADHNFEGGFTYYLLVEVASIGNIPEHMLTLQVPTQTYACTEYSEQSELSIQDTYMKLHQWIENKTYELDQFNFTSLEVYPNDYNPKVDQPKMTIHVPIQSS
ncbi:hypothetical protein CEY16_01350 [Halalkalibacillus sediminis]|uniref:AraC effector-binding domain-containing protein n=1 Tax=Halalkalibacillus sediminis TaxID=2018042 RepID=A0A2I0QVR5_9BACI|nr:GyrI-like domain-containing protein [Halalkalibacillus sediminis]PKR78431.1 hypothetical protein CEY16_01350 [Halalkalibacillus sediminis]